MGASKKARETEMKILITGGSGLLGKSLIETRNRNVKIVCTYVGEYTVKNHDDIKYQKLDIRDYHAYEQLFQEFRPDVTIHTAGIGSPDYAEQHREEAWDMNVRGTRNINSLCEKVNSRLVYISSNGIYDGEKAPYGEEDIPEPINYYGELKLKAEEILMKARIPCAIVRPILMYGWNHPFERSNIATYALESMAKGLKVQVYDDVFVTPLFSISCGKAIWRIINDERYDVFNIGGTERVSIFEMIKRLANIFGFKEEMVEPVQQGFFDELVKRPRDTSFKTHKMQAVLGMKALSLNEGLKAMKASRKA